MNISGNDSIQNSLSNMSNSSQALNLGFSKSPPFFSDGLTDATPPFF